jgi:hypothetical protein
LVGVPGQPIWSLELERARKQGSEAAMSPGLRLGVVIRCSEVGLRFLRRRGPSPCEPEPDGRRPVRTVQAPLLARLEHSLEALGSARPLQLARFAAAGRSEPSVAKAEAEPFDHEGSVGAKPLSADAAALQSTVKVLAGR